MVVIAMDGIGLSQGHFTVAGRSRILAFQDKTQNGDSPATVAAAIMQI